MEKTTGQILYEHLNPLYLKVCLYSYKFRANPFYVKNDNHVEWKYLSSKAKSIYENMSKTHHHTVHLAKQLANTNV